MTADDTRSTTNNFADRQSSLNRCWLCERLTPRRFETQHLNLRREVRVEECIVPDGRLKRAVVLMQPFNAARKLIALPELIKGQDTIGTASNERGELRLDAKDSR